MKIVRVPIFHEGTYRAIVRVALRGARCLHYREQYWWPMASGRGYCLFRRMASPLPLIQESVDDYEWFVYSRMLQGQIGEDGVLRPRSRLFRAASGAYRSQTGAFGRTA